MTAPLPGRLTLREVARPAMVAYEILATQQRQAAPLVAEAQELLKTADEVLRHLGMAQLLAAPAGIAEPSDKADQAAGLAAAYSAAGLAWARLIAHVATLADHYAANGDGSQALAMLDVLKNAGEKDTANRTLQRVGEGLNTWVRTVCRLDARALDAREIRTELSNIESILDRLSGIRAATTQATTDHLNTHLRKLAARIAALLQSRHGGLPNDYSQTRSPVEQSYAIMHSWSQQATCLFSAKAALGDLSNQMRAYAQHFAAATGFLVD